MKININKNFSGEEKHEKTYQKSKDSTNYNIQNKSCKRSIRNSSIRSRLYTTDTRLNRFSGRIQLFESADLFKSFKRSSTITRKTRESVSFPVHSPFLCPEINTL